MLQRNQGNDRANAFNVLQYANTRHAATGSDFRGIGFAAARGFFGNLFDTATSTAVDQALNSIAVTSAARPVNPDWINFAEMEMMKSMIHPDGGDENGVL